MLLCRRGRLCRPWWRRLRQTLGGRLAWMNRRACGKDAGAYRAFPDRALARRFGDGLIIIISAGSGHTGDDRADGVSRINLTPFAVPSQRRVAVGRYANYYNGPPHRLTPLAFLFELFERRLF